MSRALPSLGTVGRDLRALGSSAPLRAAYEASKRSGFHQVVFRQLPPTTHRSRPTGIGVADPPLEVRERCLADAGAILDEGVRVFGHRAPTGVSASWCQDPLTGEVWPCTTPWWKVDIRTDRRLSDVKLVWEAGRHRDLVVLARAARLEPDGRWLDGLVRLLKRWCEECRPEEGVHWYSSLELALRAVAWDQVLSLSGERLPEELRAAVDHQLVASARHIMMELPYTVSSMKNNHMLGDGLGLVLLGRMFPTHPGASRWERVGDWLFHKQLRRHMRPDGSMIEDSLGYHRFVLEMLAVRMLLGDVGDECATALSDGGRHLERLGVLAGEVPQYGDWDEGRVLADSSPAGSVAGAALLARVLSGDPVPESAWLEHDELAWYADRPSGAGALDVGDETPAATRTGEFQVVQDGPWRVWFKVACGPSHRHSDVSSVWVRRDDQWLVRDPGTGTYNGPLAVRNGFRGSSAHPVWQPEGVDQMLPHRAFRFLRNPNGYAAEPRRRGEATLLFAWHDAFVSEEEPSRVARAVLVQPEAVTIADFIERPGARVWEMTVPLGTQDIEPFGLPGLSRHFGEDEPFRGWHSSTYHDWSPSRWLVARTREKATAWGVGRAQALDASEGRITIADWQLRVEWAAESVVLHAEHPGGSERLEVRGG